MNRHFCTEDVLEAQPLANRPRSASLCRPRAPPPRGPASAAAPSAPTCPLSSVPCPLSSGGLVSTPCAPQLPTAPCGPPASGSPEASRLRQARASTMDGSRDTRPSPGDLPPWLPAGVHHRPTGPALPMAARCLRVAGVTPARCRPLTLSSTPYMSCTCFYAGDGRSCGT